MEFTSFCTLFGSSVAFPIIHPSIGVFVIRLRRNQFQILRSLLFTFQAENWTTSGGVEELCEKGQTSTHTHHTTPPPSQRNFSGGKLSGSNRLRERERDTGGERKSKSLAALCGRCLSCTCKSNLWPRDWNGCASRISKVLRWQQEQHPH